MIDTVLMERVSEGMRGRVGGVVGAMAWMGSPLGVLAAGFMIEGVGLRATILATGSLYALVTVGALLVPGLRGMDRDHHSPSTIAESPATIIA